MTTEIKDGPTWSEVHQRANQCVTESGEWAGAPIPIHLNRLVLEPKYPYHGLNGLNLEDLAADTTEEEEPAAGTFKFRNQWTDKRSGLDVMVFEENGKVGWCYWPEHTPQKRWEFQIGTLGVAASGAWSIAAEVRAIEKLRTLISDHAFKCYFLSGQFLETSPRSKVTYLFRRSRPTVAMRPRGDSSVPIAFLCAHPIGYYADSFAGVMVPTDCVIAHLMLMRGDEHRLWKICNQHRLGTAQAGV